MNIMRLAIVADQSPFGVRYEGTESLDDTGGAGCTHAYTDCVGDDIGIIV